MQSAAGGTSQRLKPAVAIVRSLSRNPVPAPGMVPALLIDVIAIFPLQPTVVLGVFVVFDPVVTTQWNSPILLCRAISGTRGDRHARSRTPTLMF